MGEARKWIVNSKGKTGYIENGYFHRPTYQTIPFEVKRAATEEEIAVFLAEEEALKAKEAKRDTEEQMVLDLVGKGLVRNDFCRFRGVYEADGIVVVNTRENGVDGLSTEAIRKAGDALIGRHTDDGDCTYEWYRFRIQDGVSERLGV